MAKQEIKTVHPEAELEPRPSDLSVPLDRLDLYAGLSLFAGMKVDFFEKFPGTGVVRRFRKGEVVCRQGESGWTAFIILPGEDALKLLQTLPRDGLTRDRLKEIDAEIAALQQAVASPEAKPREAATVHLTLASPAGKERGWFARKPRDRPTPQSIPIDGPADLDSQTLRAALREGELFGEMSCFYRTPRSATVVADRDCYMLEMLRNVLDQLKKDKNFKKRLDDSYKERALGLQLRDLPLFKDLKEEQIQKIRDKAKLTSCRAGQVICDEHDRSDEMFIVRSGLVKVVKGVSSLFTAADVARWKPPSLPAEGPPTGSLGKLWTALPANVQALLRATTDFAALSAAERQAVADAFNVSVKAGPLWKVKEWEAAARDASFAARLGLMPDNPKEWSELDVRGLNRMLVEVALFGVSTFRRPAAGVETVLAYRGRGESIGEMGLMAGEPRSATCVAYIHPRAGLARKEAVKQDDELVELVHLSQALFDELKVDPSFRAKVEQITGERRRSDVEALKAPTGSNAPPVQRSEEFSRLGLIQGQKLMLIDLDRCTRCDECVRACVNTHDDGYSRLFLDGPRFGRFLVPLSCRSCLDPVCMIGCPVGAIHRGANRQMVIEDWCIGCDLCARQCPYGSIQMHDIGVVPEGAHGWRYRPAEEGDAWTKPNHRDRAWLIGAAPFALNRDFVESLRGLAGAAGGPPAGRPFSFRLEFSAAGELLREKKEFSLVLMSPDPAAAVWVNGRRLETSAELKRGERPYSVPAAGVLRPGRNVVAVKATPPEGHVGAFFDLRLDAVQKPNVPEQLAAQYVEKGVTQRAVVCDLCSSQPGQVPACVNACPHDAAQRVNALREFPER